MDVVCFARFRILIATLLYNSNASVYPAEKSPEFAAFCTEASGFCA